MTRFYLNAGALNRWMHQNKAQYTGAYIEGVGSNFFNASFVFAD